MHGGRCETCGLDTCRSGGRCKFYPRQNSQQLEDLGIQPTPREGQVRLEDNSEQRSVVRSGFDEDANSIGSDGIHFDGVGYVGGSGEDSEEDTLMLGSEETEEGESGSEEESDSGSPKYWNY